MTLSTLTAQQNRELCGNECYAQPDAEDGLGCARGVANALGFTVVVVVMAALVWGACAW